MSIIQIVCHKLDDICIEEPLWIHRHFKEEAPGTKYWHRSLMKCFKIGYTDFLKNYLLVQLQAYAACFPVLHHQTLWEEALVGKETLFHVPPSFFPARPCEDTPSSPPLVSLLPLFLSSVPVFFAPADTFRSSGAGVCAWHFNRGRFQNYRRPFWHEKNISAWAEEVSADREVLNARSALRFSRCDPSSIPLSALSDRSSLWTHVFNFTSPTFIPVTARTCPDEWLSAFCVCRVNTPGLASSRKTLMSKTISHFSDMWIRLVLLTTFLQHKKEAGDPTHIVIQILCRRVWKLLSLLRKCG